MLRCAWCMKKLKSNSPVYGLSVQFAEGIDYSGVEGTIIQIRLNSRNTSVPIMVTAKASEAKNQGTDGVFAVCSEKCGQKMKDTVTKENNTFNGFMDITIN